MRRSVETNQGEPTDGIVSRAINSVLYYGNAKGPKLAPYNFLREHPAIVQALAVAANMVVIVVAAVHAIHSGRTGNAVEK